MCEADSDLRLCIFDLNYWKNRPKLYTKIANFRTYCTYIVQGSRGSVRDVRGVPASVTEGCCLLLRSYLFIYSAELGDDCPTKRTQKLETATIALHILLISLLPAYQNIELSCGNSGSATLSDLSMNVE